MTRWLVALTLLGLVGCGSDRQVMYKEGFVHPTHPYMVRTAGGGARILPGDWTVDNYEQEDGTIGAAKVGEDYWFGVALDNDGDGVNEYFEDVARYDLRLVNGVTDSEIFVRTLPMSSKLSRTEADVLLRRFIDAIGQTGQLSGELPAKTDRTVPQQFATRIIEQSSGAAFAGLQGLTATFEYTNVAKSEVTKGTSWRRVKVIMARPDFNWSADGKTLPAMMVVGYAADPEQFDKATEGFQAFQDSVELLDDGQLVGLVNNLMLSECQPDPNSVNVKLNVKKSGSRRNFSVEPEQNDDITLCMHSVLDQVQLPARAEARTAEWRFAKNRNPLKARALPTPPVVEEPVVEEPVVEEPAVEEPSTDEPSTDEPSTDEPSTDEPTDDEPSTDEASPEG